ncbi:unnamed protein product [Spirodela intermedia]|uniref:Domain X domain-containing protein n=1 Tax=Spirodela intermedia TaxID=51605 RepID=A0A7I8KXA0_SPIIN|nr:unnamed protein product [Spirodela intermedia]
MLSSALVLTGIRRRRRREVFPFLLRSIFSSSAAAAATVWPENRRAEISTAVPISPGDLEALVRGQFCSGKFCDLLRSVVSRPSVLLTACGNITPLGHGDGGGDKVCSLEAVDRFGLSVEQLSRELRRGEFDLESCCIRMFPSRVKGESLVLPNLKLKVVMEAVRMTLEAIYDPRLCTFSYGGRSGMGRHTAVRYLKSAVENPTWWFRVALHSERFGLRHVRRLIAIMEEKIEDPSLARLLQGLFVSEVLLIELGGLNMGRGFPQESGLRLILLSIYFNGLDHDLQDLRLHVQRQNPRILPVDGRTVFHNPVRLYAVRYLDELLVITSGSKTFTMNVKERVIRYLESNLDLKVNRLDTTIHSAVSEKMNFIGMELQAVPPSVLHPPMSEKAIRARKKYLKQKAAKALELKNARETIRKKLGLKILNHVFKKLKKCGEFKFDFRIESEVRELFRDWAQEVVKEFFQSKEELWTWHRALTSGDFLNLKEVRDQLPTELIQAYDHFQDKVNEHMKPEVACRLIGEEDGRESDVGYDEGREEEEEMEKEEDEEEEVRYAERTVEDLRRLCMRVNAPIEAIRRAVKMAGFTNNKGRPRPIKLLISLEDMDIIKWYAGVGIKWLEFFCCCRNFRVVKTVVNYHLRFSCFLTLAEKHESTKREAIKHYTKDLKAMNKDGLEEVYFPTEREIKMMGDQRLSDPKPVDGALCMILVKLASCETSCSCVAHFCGRADTHLYRVRLLQNRLNVDPSNEEKWVQGMGAVHESLNKKCLPLCSKHAGDLYLGKISLQDIDCTSFVDI